MNPVDEAESSARIGPRLPLDVQPSRYFIELAIDPRAERFTGRVRILAHVSRPIRRIQMHAEDLAIQTAKVEAADGVREARVVVDGPGRISLLIADRVSGDVALELTYGASLVEGQLGLIPLRQGALPAVFSLLEPTGARRVVPSFDEPGFKARFDVTLEVPAGQMALSNGPLLSTTRQGENDVLRFATTPPLPTYSLAFAVGQFDVLDAPIGGLPHRLVTPKGQLEQARYAAQQAPAILGALTRYFGGAFPYAKLDQMAIPGFPAGGMENAGLVNYLDSVLLMPSNAGAERQTQLRSMMAHELAHMWFGNHVTMRWWNDLWLNEALATWMSEKVMFEIAPELDSPLWAVTNMLDVMVRDALPSAQPIQHVIEDAGDIENAFDSITYKKGFAVLRMLEGWLGERDFQAGIRQYLARHAGGNAELKDLEQALEDVSRKPVGHVLRPFVTQPGTPVLSLGLTCDDSRAKLRYDIHRYRSASTPASANGEWPVPVCMQLYAGQRQQTTCLVLEPGGGEQALEVDFCPEFFHPNAGETGYYHWQVAPDELLALATRHRKRLGLAERIGLAPHASALWEAGAISAATYLEVLRGSAQEGHRFVLQDVVADLNLIGQIWPAAAPREPLARFAADLLTPHLRRVGARSKLGDPVEFELVRRALVQSAFELQIDAGILDAAKKTAKQFLADPSSVPEGDARVLLPIAARHGDQKLHAELRRLLDATPARAPASLFASALGSFGDAALLVRSYDLWLSGGIPANEFWILVQPSGLDAGRRQTFWHWYLLHAEAVAKRLGASSRWLPMLSSNECTREGIVQAREHFSAAPGLAVGYLDNLEKAQQTAERCLSLRERRGPELVAALGRP